MIENVLLGMAALLWFFDTLPQLVKVCHTRKAGDISIAYIFMSGMAYLCFHAAHILAGRLCFSLMYALPAIATWILLVMVVKHK